MSDPRLAPTSNLGADGRVSTRRYQYNNTIVYDVLKDGGSEQAEDGLYVTLTGTDGEVGLVGDGEQVEGKLELCESDGWCTVRTSGCMEAPGGSGATLTIGARIVGALGAASAEGYIRAVNTAVAAELGVARGRIVENDDTAAVVIEL